jgi:hypothetical protein
MGYLSDRLSPSSVWAQALRRPPSGPERRMTADDPRPGVLPQPTLVPATDVPLADRIGTFLAQYLPENTLVPQLPWDALANEQGGTTPDPKPTAEIVSNLVAMLPGMSIDEIQYGNSGGMDVFNTALGGLDILGLGAVASTLAKPLARAGVNVAEDAARVADDLPGIGHNRGPSMSDIEILDAARVADDVPGITAYHGSPHTFDQFRWDDTTRGTGEGAQAFGDGLYFAEAEDVARTYRGNADARFNRVTTGAMTPREEFAFDMAQGGARDWDIMKALQSRYGDNIDFDEAKALADNAIASGGSMYQVRLNANPEDFLDWDAPLSGQRAWEKIKSDWDANLGDPSIIMERLGIDEATSTGRQYIESLGPLSSGAVYEGISATLRKQGIPGIRFLDGNSRGLGEGTSNYTVWDDSIIEILKRYGLIPPVAAGSAMLMNGNEAEASQ